MAMQEHTDCVSIVVPPFSKLLDIQIESHCGIPHRFVALVEIDTLYEYAKTIAIEKNELTSYSSGSTNLNLSLASSNSIYRIFASEIKSTAELRDSKISELIEG